MSLDSRTGIDNLLPDRKLGVALVGAGFISNFHARSWPGVRDSEIVAICSKNPDRARKLRALCETLGVGKPAVYTDVGETVRDPRVDAVWLCVPNDSRVPVLKSITEEKMQGRTNLVGIACEKPLASNLKDAKEMIKLVEKAGLLHGYLENQIFSPSLARGRDIIWEHAKKGGRPYLAKASEEHGGPHSSWFWDPRRSGGGVMMDMMCHSLEATRFLLSDPERAKDELKVRTITADVNSLKWTRTEYATRLREITKGEVDYSKTPAEDYARALITYELPETGTQAVADLSVLWCFSGPGLRLNFELVGPEYYMHVNTLQPDLHVFFSRNLRPQPGEYLIEKQEAEQGLMPVVSDETFTYGYQAEDNAMVQSFLNNKLPTENWYDGLFILELVLSCYLAAEQGRKIRFSRGVVDDYVPMVAKGEWTPGDPRV